MRYFYRNSYFEISDEEKYYRARQQRKSDLLYKALVDDNGLAMRVAAGIGASKPVIPSIFEYNEYDIRLWTPTNLFIEIDKDAYNRIYTDEQKILKDKGVIKAKLKAWHSPIKIVEEDAEETLKKIFKLETIEIRELCV